MKRVGKESGGQRAARAQELETRLKFAQLRIGQLAQEAALVNYAISQIEREITQIWQDEKPLTKKQVERRSKRIFDK